RPPILNDPTPARCFWSIKYVFSFWQTLSTSLRASARSEKTYFISRNGRVIKKDRGEGKTQATT
ncbi:MAG: hypothetical protein NTZ65_00050, partial [Candidatus Berkelbacteria bacterium]|nr:hypothetical protein [Candidatus Berkelbacteria bacterium]